jgi:hypothetical protein
MKKTIECTTYIELEYDENSPEFKEALASYKECIDHEGSADDMLKHVCHNFIHFGVDTMVDGVGYIKPNYRELYEEEKKLFSGITLVSSSFPTFDFEFED